MWLVSFPFMWCYWNYCSTKILTIFFLGFPSLSSIFLYSKHAPCALVSVPSFILSILFKIHRLLSKFLMLLLILFSVCSYSIWAAVTKYHKTVWLTHNRMYFSQLWMMEVQDQGASLVGENPLLAYWLLSEFSHGRRARVLCGTGVIGALISFFRVSFL